MLELQLNKPLFEEVPLDTKAKKLVLVLRTFL